jgi:hypothetical protein
MPTLEPHEGLLTLSTRRRSSASKLPLILLRNEAQLQKSRKLSIKEMIKMVQHQTGTLSSALAKMGRMAETDKGLGLLMTEEPEQSDPTFLL